MPILSTDIQYRLSGGAGNASGNASLGGAKSSTSAAAAVNLFFDAVSGGEASAGDTEYRCFYAHNAHATLVAQNTVIWIQANTPSASTTVDIGLGTSAINGTEQTIADEQTAPTSVTFSAPSTQGTALFIGNIPAGQHKAVWMRRTISAAAPAVSGDSATLRVYCDTLP